MLIRCGVLGGTDWAARLQGSPGLELVSLGEDLRQFRPEEQRASLDVLVIAAAAIKATGAQPSAIYQSLRRLLPGCIHLCLRELHDADCHDWPEADLFLWPDDAFRLFRRLHETERRTIGGAWWDDPSVVPPPVATTTVKEMREQMTMTEVAATVEAVASPAPARAAATPVPAMPGPAVAESAAPVPTAALSAVPVAPASASVYVPRWPSTTASSPHSAQPGHTVTGQLISVIGAKGGVGQTWLAVNLAIALAGHIGMECLLADLDLACSDIAVHLDLLGSPTVVDLVQQGDGDSWPWSYLHQLRSCSLRVLTGPERPQMASLLGPEAVVDALQKLQGQFAYTICDHAPGDTDPLFQTVSEGAAAIVLVTTLEASALRQAKLRLEHLQQRGLHGRTHIVFNQMGPGGIPPGDGAAYLEHQAFTVIPADRKRIDQSIHEARPLALQPRSELGQAVSALAAVLCGNASEPEQSESGWRKWVEQLWKR